MENRKLFIKYLVIILVLIGGLGVLGKLQERVSGHKEDVDEKEMFEVNNLMGASKKTIKDEELRNGYINCAMGEVQIDLTQALPSKNSNIEVFVTMGAVKITVPKDWRVVLDATSIMGASKDFNDGLEGQIDENKVLNIEGTVIMGALEIYRI
ncbi:hypothetical protein EGI22_11765 [Lacihabitans sp. LS3-19]|uniref:LiaF domain-containing protein n=1 Tax=Lacihabitans sp. LS3-19 TaxID=2487335 RepID=UPI0020CBB6BB|nr:LiaF domain-containing protein [Lacihabitans sp. LS3-19]MCP9768592.1 hypothetical protein [Lacihabitans sp. LS3-19]